MQDYLDIMHGAVSGHWVVLEDNLDTFIEEDHWDRPYWSFRGFRYDPVPMGLDVGQFMTNRFSDPLMSPSVWPTASLSDPLGSITLPGGCDPSLQVADDIIEFPRCPIVHVRYRRPLIRNENYPMISDSTLLHIRSKIWYNAEDFSVPFYSLPVTQPGEIELPPPVPQEVASTFSYDARVGIGFFCNDHKLEASDVEDLIEEFNQDDSDGMKTMESEVIMLPSSIQNCGTGLYLMWGVIGSNIKVRGHRFSVMAQF